ncbi:PCI-domain-containing protein [Pterulicium gracile]|uniref:PCI-domain-containing protein n=1 Tax=Pterulicium gracile TaxID=1884261 RepID=A0A5C3QFN3_9AGAR|nr:PCI-domain-containing protein [Pterula gracilis]
MADEQVLPIPNLALSQALFVLSSPSLSHLHDKYRPELLDGIKVDSMTPYYRSITSAASPVLPLDQALLEEMEGKNSEEEEKLKERLEQAEKTEGETEIAEALRAKADFLTRVGDREAAVTAQKLALSKTPGLGSKIDIVLTLVRIGFFFGDQELISEYLKEAERLVEEGGDWDRRNRLKVYTGLHLLSIRQFTPAAALLLDALSTFTAVELVSYNDYVALTVIANTLVLSRPDLKKKIIQSSEVISALPELPTLGDLVKSLYECHYDKFFVALAETSTSSLLPSRLLAPHARYYVRECRIRAYAQLLESYRSLTLESMAKAFGVSEVFIDGELSRFISSGRLSCTIDKVNGIVSTTRGGETGKEKQYDSVVMKGDVLLGKLQRLSKVLY